MELLCDAPITSIIPWRGRRTNREESVKGRRRERRGKERGMEKEEKCEDDVLKKVTERKRKT